MLRRSITRVFYIMKRLIYLFIFLILSLFMFSVNFMNPQLITLNYYFGLHAELPLVLVLTAVFLFGLLLGSLFMSLSVFKNKRERNKLQRELMKAENELLDLKPASDEIVKKPS